jgi:uncharacterized protein
MFISNKLKVWPIKKKGLGIIATEAIKANEILEMSPVIIMTQRERELLDQTLLHDYIFVWGQAQNQCCMAQGYISIYNHSYTSNCEYFMDFDANTITIKAVRDIDANEELTINYNGDWNNKTPVWFDVVTG